MKESAFSASLRPLELGQVWGNHGCMWITTVYWSGYTVLLGLVVGKCCWKV